jgi:hypothetical protein
VPYINGNAAADRESIAAAIKTCLFAALTRLPQPPTKIAIRSQALLKVIRQSRRNLRCNCANVSWYPLASHR